MPKCANCGGETDNPKFCCGSCATAYSNRGRPSHNLIDETDNVYGNLTVISRNLDRGTKKAFWNVLCSCGTVEVISGSRLRSGKTGTCSKCRKVAKGKFSIPYIGMLYRQYNFNAKTRGLKFNLSPEQFEQITSQRCFYCGENSSSNQFAMGFVGNGIDRVNNDSGYTFSNVVACCSLCNKMKSKLSVKEFLDQCMKIYTHSSVG